MKIERFEDIIAWQKAKQLTEELYTHFQNHKDYGFKNQILRAAVSIMNNIAEGFERNTNKELVHFLYIAKGSCGEVRSMLYLAESLKKMPNKPLSDCQQLTIETSKTLSGFIKSLQPSH